MEDINVSINLNFKMCFYDYGDDKHCAVWVAKPNVSYKDISPAWARAGLERKISEYLKEQLEGMHNPKEENDKI